MSDRIELVLYEMFMEHPDTPGRVKAATLLPSDDELCEDVGAALEGWFLADLAADFPHDVSDADWFEVADRLLFAGVHEE
jgi:hypothetical protein